MARSRRQASGDESGARSRRRANAGSGGANVGARAQADELRSAEVSALPAPPSRRRASAGSFGTNVLVSAQEDTERSGEAYSWILMRAVLPILAIAAAAFYKLLGPG